MSTSTTEQADSVAASEPIRVAAKHADPDPTSLSLDVRDDFPILSREIEGKPLIYLDSGATSQKPRAVIDSIDAYYKQRNANVHRGVYPLAQEADAAYDGARTKVARFVGWDPKTTIFTKNVTEAINLVAYAWGRANVGEGDAIVTTQMEHHANIVPWQQLCKARAHSCAIWRWTTGAKSPWISSTASWPRAT